MLEFYKTFDNVTKRIDQPEHGCWINAVSPNEEEIAYGYDWRAAGIRKVFTG